MPKPEELQQLCVQVPLWLDLMGTFLAFSEGASKQKNSPTQIPINAAGLKEGVHDFQLRLAALLAQCDSNPGGGRFQPPDDWFLLSVSGILRLFISSRHGLLKDLQESDSPEITPRAALKRIADFSGFQSGSETIEFAMLIALMFEWSMRWVARLARERLVSRYPMFLPVDRFPDDQSPLSATELGRHLSIVRGRIDNIVSEARKNNKDFGGLCEGELLYPGSKMNGVICNWKPRGGYLYYLAPPLPGRRSE